MPSGPGEVVDSERYTLRAAGPEEDPDGRSTLEKALGWNSAGWRCNSVRIPENAHCAASSPTLGNDCDIRPSLRLIPRARSLGRRSCQRWEGPFPMIAACPSMDLGTVWCIFVNPEHRRQGLGTRLMACCVEHWRKIGCTRGILMYASELGRRLYVKVGFAPGNVLLLESVCPDAHTSDGATSHMQDPPTKLVSSTDWIGREDLAALSASRGLNRPADPYLRQLLLVVPYQLSAPLANGCIGQSVVEMVLDIQRRKSVLVDPLDNWFTRNLHRFGNGFDLRSLAADPAKMAGRFDRLAPRWEEYVTGCQYREVFVWLVRSALSLSTSLRTTGRFLDLACGVGLMGQTLRLTGVEGHLTGLDLSSGMLAKARGGVVATTCWPTRTSTGGFPFPIGASISGFAPAPRNCWTSMPCCESATGSSSQVGRCG